MYLLDLIKTSIRKRFKDLKSVIPKYILLKDISSAVDLLYFNTYFSCNCKFYKLIFGTLMNSTVSPILVEVFMADLEEVFKKIKLYTFHFRYADDILTCITEE